MAKTPDSPTASSEPSDETTEVMSPPETDVTLSDLTGSGDAAPAEEEDPNKAYVAPRKIPKARLPTAEDDKRIVLNLPDPSAILAPSAQDVERAKRRAPTVKVARGTLAAREEDAHKQSQKSPTGSPAIEPVEPVGAGPAVAQAVPAEPQAAVEGKPLIEEAAPISEAPAAKAPAPKSVTSRSVSRAMRQDPTSMPPTSANAAGAARFDSFGVETEPPKPLWPKVVVLLMAAAGVGGVLLALRTPGPASPGQGPTTSVPPALGAAQKTAVAPGPNAASPTSAPSPLPSAAPSPEAEPGASALVLEPPTAAPATGPTSQPVSVAQPPPTPPPVAQVPPVQTPPAARPPYTPPAAAPATNKPTGAKPGGAGTAKSDVPSSI